MVANEEPIFAPGSESDREAHGSRKGLDMDWKEKAIAAHTAKVDAEQKAKDETDFRLRTCTAHALKNKLDSVFGLMGIAIGNEAGTPTATAGDGIKFKVVRDRSKPAEDAGSWDLYMGIEKSTNLYDDAMQMDWFGPVKTLEDVGLYLTCDPRELIPPGYCYQREPEDYGSETPPQPVFPSVKDQIRDFIRGLPEGENQSEVVHLRILTEAAYQLERIALRI